MPTAVCRDDGISLLRPPATAFVRTNAVMVLQDRIDDHPRCLNRVFSCKQRTVAGHGVTKKPLVGRFLSRLFIRKIKLSILSDEFLTSKLYAGS